MKPLINIQKALNLVLVLFLCASTVGVAQAGQDAAPLGTLQDLINAAPDGGTVNITTTGTYSETLLVDKNLTIKGVSSILTILQPDVPNHRVIKVTAGHNLRLENLRVTGGHPDTVGDTGGGGIYLAGGNLELDYVKIDHNQGSFGGGVYQEGSTSSVTASNCLIDDNIASASGGGLFTLGSASLSYTLVQNNTAANDGGGMTVMGTASLTGGAFISNHALNGNGGGVNVNDGLTVDGTQFSVNTAAGTSGDVGSGGAIAQWNQDKTVSISGAVFNGNSAQVNGGAVYIRGSFLTLSGSDFTGNTVDSGNNNVNTFGGGVYAGGGLDGSHLNFVSNSAKCTNCSGQNGGGLYIKRPSTGPSSVTQSTFDGNQAWLGSGIFSDTTIQLTLSNCYFINNGNLTAGQPPSGYGGGVKATWVHGDQLLFQNNKVMNYGGGLEADDSVLTNSRFIGNLTDNYGHGGGVSSSHSFSGTNLLFDGDDASGGAAVYVKSGSAVLHHATIGRPPHGAGSAIEAYYGTTLEVENSIITAYDEGVRVEGTLNEDYNLYFNNGNDFINWGTIYPGGHSIHGYDPLFAAAAAGNYHLRRGSPAIGLGANLGVTTDLDSRPRIGRWDAGAYQFYIFIYLPTIRK